MALTATKTWSQKNFSEELASMGATDYYSVTGPLEELANDRKAVRAQGIPKLGQSHATHLLLKATSIEAGPGLAERVVSVRYQWNPPASSGSGGNQTNQVRISWSDARRAISLSRDQSGNLITNSAGDIPDPLPQDDILAYTVTITRWESKFDIVQAYKFTGKVNSDDMIAGGVKFPKGTVRCISIMPAEDYAPDQNPIPISYTLEIRTALGGQETDFAKYPFLYWVADVGTRSHYSGGNMKQGDLYWKDGTLVGDRVDQPVPLFQGAPLESSDFLVTSLGKAPQKKNRLPSKNKPRYVRVDGVYWIGWSIYGEANLLLLGL